MSAAASTSTPTTTTPTADSASTSHFSNSSSASNLNDASSVDIVSGIMQKLKDEWTKMQDEIRTRVEETDRHDDWSVSDSEWHVSRLGGCDISFFGSDQRAIAALIVLDVSSGPNPASWKVIHQSFDIVEMKLPYVSGFLAFREVPPIAQLLTRLKSTAPHLYPQVLMVDGNGILHHRLCGLACHLGVTADIPCFGVAKTLLHADGLSHQTELDAIEELANKAAGSAVDLVGQSGKVLGRALKAADDTKNPVFVSIGHRISLHSATLLAAKSCLHRVPEPTRIADIKSREEIRKFLKNDEIDRKRKEDQAKEMARATAADEF